MSLLPACWLTPTIGIIEMIDFGIGFIIGLMIGLVLKPKDKDLVEQQAIYDKRIAQYEIDIAYYKELCHWHVEQRKTNESKTSGSL